MRSFWWRLVLLHACCWNTLSGRTASHSHEAHQKRAGHRNASATTPSPSLPFADRLSLYYTQSALSFLSEYGAAYELFDMFRDNTRLSHGSDEFPRRWKSIESEHYLLRNFSRFATWNNAQITLKEEMEPSWPRYRYVTTDAAQEVLVNDDIRAYNDRFRFGAGPDERFLAVVLDADPWRRRWRESEKQRDKHRHVNGKTVRESETYTVVSSHSRDTRTHNMHKTRSESTLSTQGKAKHTKHKPTTPQGESESGVRVHFVGVNTALRVAQYSCVFSYPLRLETRAFVDYNVRNVLNVKTNNNRVNCPVPKEIIHAIEEDNEYAIRNIAVSLQRRAIDTTRPIEIVNDTTIEVYTPVDHRTHISRNKDQQANINAKAETLLRDVLLFPSHPLDRRSFGIVLQTMTHTLNDPMLLEWLVYNVLLGVEHFYVYCDLPLTADALRNARIRPFLDANLVTLVYFPFYHTQHFNQVQYAALNAHLLMFGAHSEWVGYWDFDEFFVPAPALVDEFFASREMQRETQRRNGTTIHDDAVPVTLLAFVIDRLQGGERSPGIMFDSLDMDCDPDTERERQRNSLAYSTHCLRTGKLFNELKMSHGKMLVRPRRMNGHIASIHRLTDYWTVWTTQHTGGLFRHFNGFRYTNIELRRGAMKESELGRDDALRNLTSRLMRTMLGVKLDF